MLGIADEADVVFLGGFEKERERETGPSWGKINDRA